MKKKLLAFSVLLLLLISLKSVPSSLVNPLSGRANVFDNIKARLEQRPNHYKLKVTRSLSKLARYEFDEAASYIVADMDTGEILAEKNSVKRHPIASLTKIMTSVVALDLIAPDEKIKVSRNATLKIPTKIGLVAGEKLTAGELLHATLLTSANDAAQAIQDGIDHKFNQEVFIRAMNEKARSLKLKDSHFDNPQGFDSPDNYSSAADLAVLAHYTFANYPLLKEIVQKDYHFLPATQEHKQFDLYNWNGLIGVYPNTLGFKIGNTDAAGMTTLVVAEREGKRILAVVLGAPDVLQRDLWAAQLLDYGFQKTLNLPEIAVTPLQLQEKYLTWQFWN